MRLWLCALFLAGFHVTAQGSADTSSTATRLDGYLFVQDPPAVIHLVAPQYPDAAVRSGIKGRVVVLALIGTHGRVRETRVAESVPGLDEAAREAVAAWEFKPPYIEDRLQPVWAAMPVYFPPDSKPANVPAYTERIVPTAAFRARLSAASDSAWARSATLVALTLVGADCQCSGFTVDVQSQPERFDDAEVTVTRDGLMDDSVRGERYRLRLRRDPRGRWKLETATYAFRCQLERGHEEYSIEPCR